MFLSKKCWESSQPTTVCSNWVPQVTNIPVVNDIESLHEGNIYKDNNQSSSSGFVHDAKLLSGYVTICQVKLEVTFYLFV